MGTPKQISWHVILAAFIVAASLAGCGSTTEPTKPSAWQILVNPGQPVANRYSQYTMLRADDTGFTAYKYLWDYDERNTILKRDLKSNLHVYSDTDAHNITCYAQDSLDHVIGEGHVRVKCIPPTDSITIESLDDPVDWRSRRFVVHEASHHYSWIYSWDFGDGTTITAYDTTTKHRYANTGEYTVTLSVAESSYLIGSDTAQIRIVSPVVRASDLNAMTSVTMYVVDTTGAREQLVQIPLMNDALYSYTAAPAFSSAYRYATQVTKGQTILDTARVRLLEATLDATGLMLSDFRYFALDTNHLRDESHEVFSGCARSYATASLEVQFFSTDSIGFISEPGSSLYVDCHDSTSTHPSTGSCDPIDPIRLTPREVSRTFGTSRILLAWRKS